MRRKISALIAAITIVLLTVTATFTALQMYPAKVYGNPAISDSVSMSPMTLILGTLPETDTYWVNVTSISTASTDYINNVSIELPTGWTYNATVGAVAYGFGTYSISAGNSGAGTPYWVNFTTTSVAFYNGAIANFSIPIAFSTISAYPTTGTWTIYCYQDSIGSTSNPLTVTVTVNLQFYGTMSPNYVMNGTSYIYTVTVTNNYCPIGINTINITFPTVGWGFKILIEFSPLTWTVAYNNINTFMLTGPNILEGSAVSIMVNMTVPATAGPPWYFYWVASAWSSTSAFLGNYSMPAVIDNTPPSISVSAPSALSQPYYSVGAGNYIWINASVSDTPSMATYFSQYSVTVNDTSRFTLQSVSEVGSTNTFDYCWVNVTYIPDGPLNVLITAVDPAGNVGTALAHTTVDNTAPQLLWIEVVDQNGSPLNLVHGTYWMSASTMNISVAAAFYNLQAAGALGTHGTIYFNKTGYPFANSTNVVTNWMPTAPPGYSVYGSNLVTLNITLTDSSSPTANRYTFTWTVMRETTLPSVPSYTKTQTICGGFVIWGLTATDNVGISYFNIILNGTTEFSLSPLTLNSPTLSGNMYYGIAVQNITVINLFYHGFPAGSVANITIDAVNFGLNTGPSVTFLVTVPAGQWYPIEMEPKWNLISLPLIPNSTATASIYSLMLINGAAGVNFAESFDNVGKTWTLNPTSMSDGNAYWINMNAYDVLIVQGYPIWAPPGSPPAIVQYSLSTGWNLAGFTLPYEYDAPNYVASLQYTSVLQSYFRFAYVWDPVYQEWYTVDLLGIEGTTSFQPGQGFYIYMYNSQTLIPPIPY